MKKLNEVEILIRDITLLWSAKNILCFKFSENTDWQFKVDMYFCHLRKLLNLTLLI